VTAAPATTGWRRWVRHAAAREFLRSPLFWLGLAIKLVVGSLFASAYLRDSFAPFVNQFVLGGFANPWDAAMQAGQTKAFPYPPAMLYALALPRTVFAWLLPGDPQTVTFATLFVLRLPLLIADIAIGVLLAAWFPQRVKLILVAYWLSPLAFYITYWHGQLDILPTAVFLVSLFFLRRRQWLPAAVVLGVALATKSHLWVAVPFVVVHLLRREGSRVAGLSLLAVVAVAVVCQLPWLLSPEYRAMVFGSDEQRRALALAFPMGDSGLKLIAAPIALVLLWLRFLSYRVMNWDLMLAYLGIAFCVFVLLAPPRPGYFLWSLPFIVAFFARQGGKHLAPFHLYGLACLAFFLTGPESDLYDAVGLLKPEWKGTTPYTELAARVGGEASLTDLRNILFAVAFACMASILMSMYLIGVRSNSIHRMRTKPLLVGMAGDSGAGKDTVCRLLEMALGRNRCNAISGDDYHRWPRGHQMWQVHTHLDVRANDLVKQQNHAIAIARGEGVRKGTYDHATGQFTQDEWVDPSNYVIFAGLHTLALESQRSLYELTVFINPDEPLRRNWKVRRDHAERGYTPAQVLAKLEEREADRLKFIVPQADHAELVVSFRNATPLAVDDLATPLDLVLDVTGNNGFAWGALADELGQVPTLSVEHDSFISTTRQKLTARGTIPATAVAEIAYRLLPNLDEMADRPTFEPDLNGVLQLALLVSLADKLRWAESASPEEHRRR
jgi:uridine kinase